MTYDPCIPEAITAWETITNRHKREIFYSSLNWERIEVDGQLIQLLPIFVLEFKFGP